MHLRHDFGPGCLASGNFRQIQPNLSPSKFLAGFPVFSTVVVHSNHLQLKVMKLVSTCHRPNNLMVGYTLNGSRKSNHVTGNELLQCCVMP